MIRSLTVSVRHMPKSPKRSDILDSQDPGYWKILDLIFSFSRGILEILDFRATLSWYPKDIGSQTEKLLPDHEDPRSWLGKLSCGVTDLGS